jgi:PAS domain S-box-containing protein
MDVATFRHALRTPLNHIIGYSEMLIEDTEAEKQFGPQAELRSIQRTAHQVLQVIQKRSLMTQVCLPEAEYSALRQESEPLLNQIFWHIGQLTDVLDYKSPDILRIISATEMLRELLESSVSFRDGRAPAAQRPASLCAARLLVVDDDDNNRDMLQRQLGRMGYEVETASNGPRALELLKQSPFDLILLDILMPGMDGFEVLTALQASSKLRDIPVIVLSALDEMDSVARCVEMGASDFIAKPFEKAILQSRIGAVTKRRTAERERAQLADRLRQLLESTSEGIFGIDPAGLCTFINEAATTMLGYTRDQLLGRTIHDAVHGKRAGGATYPAEECPMNRAAIDGHGSRVVDEVFWNASGEPFPVEYAVNPVYHEGQLEGAVITFTDISERKRTEERFRETAKLESLGVLAGGVAHDFNNLLTGILGNASLVLYSAGISDTDRERLGFVIQASERAADLTKQLLAYAGKGRYEIRSVDLPGLVKDTANLLQTMIPRTVTLDFKFEPKPMAVEGDPSQIQQIIMNLVINGGEAIGEPHTGNVTVSTYKDFVDENRAKKLGAHVVPGKYMVLEVSDTGCGMNGEVQARIFDPFYTTKFTGRGLGLAAVAGIVKSHRGAIEVQSALHRGSRFRVYLPSSENSSPPGIAVETPQATASSGLVLVVDDEEIILRTTRAVLENSGFRVLVASGGEEAINLFRTQAEDVSLILLDMMMPGMSGDQAFRHLRAIRPDIPIMVSSGYSESQVMRYFSGSRVSAFIQKPYTSNKLISNIGAVLDRLPTAAQSKSR